MTFSGGREGASLTWFDDRWWACESHLSWFDPVTGEGAELTTPCMAMVVEDGRLGVDPQTTTPGQWWFDTAVQAMAHNPSANTYNSWAGISRATGDGGTKYGAMHSTDRLIVFEDDTTGAPELVLEGFDTWVQGLAVSDDAIHVLDDGRQEDLDNVVRVRDFDKTTGEEISRMGVGTWAVDVYSGLWCGVPGG